MGEPERKDLESWRRRDDLRRGSRSRPHTMKKHRKPKYPHREEDE